MKNGVFVTGTDTGVGKTLVTGLLARFMIERGLGVVTQKWVQTGAPGVAEDVLTHFTIMGADEFEFREYMPDMAPYIFSLPASPHLAALEEGYKIEPAMIEAAFNRLAGRFDFVIVEGSGGVMVPVDEKTTMLDIARRLELPVIIVAANRLGAINQCLLTVEAAHKRGIEILGIVFNRQLHVTDERILKDNPYIISKFANVETLGELSHLPRLDALYAEFAPIGHRIIEKLGI